MAVTLATSALASMNDLQAGVVQSFVLSSPVLDRLPLLDISGNAYAYNAELALPGVEFRAVNAAYAESTGTIAQTTVTLVILGGDADVDTYIVKTRGNVNDQRAIQTDMKARAIAFKFQDGFINGDTAVDANSFDGLKKLLTGTQVVDTAVNGLPVIGTTDADRHSFLDRLDALMASVPGGPDALYMNGSILSKIASSSRRLLQYSTTIDQFGKTAATFNGIPMYDIGSKGDGTAIIPQTETQGTAAGTASSIYAVKFSGNEGENGVAALNNGGIDVRDLGEQDSKAVYRTRIEWFTGLAIFGKGAARLRGVLNS